MGAKMSSTDRARLTRAERSLAKARAAFEADPTLEHYRTLVRARASHTRAVRILECRAHAAQPPAQYSDDELFNGMAE